VDGFFSLSRSPYSLPIGHECTELRTPSTNEVHIVCQITYHSETNSHSTEGHVQDTTIYLCRMILGTVMYEIHSDFKTLKGLVAHTSSFRHMLGISFLICPLLITSQDPNTYNISLHIIQSIVYWRSVMNGDAN